MMVMEVDIKLQWELVKYEKCICGKHKYDRPMSDKEHQCYNCPICTTKEKEGSLK